MIWIFYRSKDGAIEDIELELDLLGEDHIGVGSDLYGQKLATLRLENISVNYREFDQSVDCQRTFGLIYSQILR